VPREVTDLRSHRRLADIVELSPLLTAVLDAMPSFGLPDCYLAAGAVAQTVWNQAFDRPPSENIKDIDLVYFDGDLQ
jgi:hypothetical protein